MATRQYDWDKTQAAYQITESVGGAISNGVRITIDLAKISSKQEIVNMIKMFHDRLIEDPWPPA